MRTISASSLSTFSRCAEQFRRRYICGERERPAGSTVMGTAIHGSAEANYGQKIVSGVDLSVPDVQLAYAESFDREVDERGGAGEIDWTVKQGRDRVKVTPGRAKDIGIPLTTAYHERVAPGIQPLGTEEWFETTVRGVPAPLVGKIDLIQCGNGGKTDLKFGAQAKSKPDVAWRTQSLIYMLVEDTDNLSGLGGMDFSWHTGSWGSERWGPKILTPTTAPELTVPYSGLNKLIAENHVEAIVAAMIAYWNSFGPDEPWPGTGLSHSWACDFCGFRPTCPWWVGPAARDQLTLL